MGLTPLFRAYERHQWRQNDDVEIRHEMRRADHADEARQPRRMSPQMGGGLGGLAHLFQILGGARTTGLAAALSIRCVSGGLGMWRQLGSQQGLPPCIIGRPLASRILEPHSFILPS